MDLAQADHFEQLRGAAVAFAFAQLEKIPEKVERLARVALVPKLRLGTQPWKLLLPERFKKSGLSRRSSQTVVYEPAGYG